MSNVINLDGFIDQIKNQENHQIQQYQITHIIKNEANKTYEVAINNNEKAIINYEDQKNSSIVKKLDEINQEKIKQEELIKIKINDYKKELNEDFNFEVPTYSKKFNHGILLGKAPQYWSYTQKISGFNEEDWKGEPFKKFYFSYKNPRGFHTDCNGLISAIVSQFAEVENGVTGYSKEEFERFKKMAATQGAEGQANFLYEMNKKYNGNIVEMQPEKLGKGKELSKDIDEIAKKLKPNSVGYFASSGKTVGHIVALIETPKGELMVSEMSGKRNDYELTNIKDWLLKNSHRKITFVDLYPNQEKTINQIVDSKKQEMIESYKEEMTKVMNEKNEENPNFLLNKEEVKQLEEKRTGTNYHRIEIEDVLNNINASNEIFKNQNNDNGMISTMKFTV